MKKAILFALVSLLAAAAAHAATDTYSASLPTSLPGKLSTNVQVVYDASTDNSGYSAGTYHSKGTRSFASSSGDAAIWAATGTAVTIPAAPTGTASADFPNTTGWGAL